MKESYDIFVPESVEQPSNASQAVKIEFLNDVSAYATPEAASIIRKKYYGQEQLSPNEMRIFTKTRDDWWLNKYGFPFEMAAEREELLERKYSFSPKAGERNALFSQLIASLHNQNKSEFKRLKEEYLALYPDQLEGVSALTDFPSNIDDSNYLDTHRASPKLPREVRERRKLKFEQCAQYNFLLTHFLLENRDDKEFLNDFWAALEKIAEAKNATRYAHGLRRGVISQVATHRVFESLGMHPELSHPSEDAFKKVDLWIEGSGAVQIKSSRDDNDELFVETEALSFPGSEVRHPDGTLAHYNGNLMSQFQEFQAKIDRYAKERGEPIKGYVAVVPYHEVDFVTGEPSRNIIARSAKSLGIALPEERDESSIDSLSPQL